jgi:hypothetical protein
MVEDRLMAEDRCVYFLECIWYKHIVPAHYDINSKKTFKEGFIFGNTETSPLIELMNYDIGKTRAIETALNGLMRCLETNQVNNWGEDSFQIDKLRCHRVYPDIEKKPFFYGVIRGVVDTADIISLGDEEIKSFFY